MPGVTVTYAGREAEVSTVLRVAAKQHIQLWHGESFQENKCTKCWLNFPISLHTQTGQEAASVTFCDGSSVDGFQCFSGSCTPALIPVQL